MFFGIAQYCIVNPQAELYALIDGQEVKTVVSTSDLNVTQGKVVSSYLNYKT